MIARFILPAGVDHRALPLLLARALRAFVEGYVAVLLPAYLLALGFGVWEVGLISTATLLGSALATLAVGSWGHSFHQRHLLLAAALLFAAGWLAAPLVACGLLKIGYDLALWRAFRRVKPGS